MDKKRIHWRVRGKNKTKQKTTGEAEGENCLVARTFKLYSEDFVLNSASAICTMHDFASYLIF